MRGFARILVLAAVTSPLVLGCESDPVGDPDPVPLAFAPKEVPVFPPASDFVAKITNPYLAFAPGRKFHYRSETAAGVEINIVEVTKQTKRILDIDTTVLHDQVFLNGELTEDTFDWVAQDKNGNVWYFGEDTKEFLPGGVVSTEGSWEAGKSGSPGIFMLANPEVGLQYKQEDAPGIAEDVGKVTSLSEPVAVSFGTYDGCLQVDEWSLVEAGPRDHKFYKSGVGLVLEVLSRGKKNTERVELTAID
jgi:hypothetical protein